MIWRLLDVGLLLAGAAAVVVGTAHWSTGAAWVVAGAACIGLFFMPPKGGA